jgi:uncharacterized protein (TIGR03437 family)
LPTRLGETSINFNGTLPAPLFYVSPQQANLQVPWELTGQKEASVSVTTGGGISAPVKVSLADAAPGLFSLRQSGNGQGVVLDSRYQLVDAANPARPGDTVQIFATGLGPVSNRPASGVASPAAPVASTLATPTVNIGGAAAPVVFSGLTPGYVGLYQVNAQVPAEASVGNGSPLVLTIGGAASNLVSLAIASK